MFVQIRLILFLFSFITPTPYKIEVLSSEFGLHSRKLACKVCNHKHGTVKRPIAGKLVLYILTKIMDYLRNTKYEGEKTVIVILDLDRAFDKVWHKGLLYKLLKLDTPSKLVAFIQFFLENKSLSVRVEENFYA